MLENDPPYNHAAIAVRPAEATFDNILSVLFYYYIRATNEQNWTIEQVPKAFK